MLMIYEQLPRVPRQVHLLVAWTKIFLLNSWIKLPHRMAVEVGQRSAHIAHLKTLTAEMTVKCVDCLWVDKSDISKM